MAYDMNPFAGGQMPSPGGQNPGAGAAAPQKATSVPGTVGNMVQAMMNGYGKYKAGLPGPSTGPSPDFPPAPAMGGPMPMGGAPMESPQQGMAGPNMGTKTMMDAYNTPLPGPVGAMPPMMPGGGAPALPFAEGTPGLPGIGEYVGPQSGAGGLEGLFGGGGMDSPQARAIAALFGGGQG